MQKLLLKRKENSYYFFQTALSRWLKYLLYQIGDSRYKGLLGKKGSCRVLMILSSKTKILYIPLCLLYSCRYSYSRFVCRYTVDYYRVSAYFDRIFYSDTSECLSSSTKKNIITKRRRTAFFIADYNTTF